ncbi:MAG: DUF3592 domain-containing protein [Cyclobacteriaceae bacterium]|nr:DUF3592 domain-containing protein [Cyclobacteriaceae bacterium]
MLSPNQKQHAKSLINSGQKLEAVRYLQNQLNVGADQALSLTEKLEEEINAEFEAELNNTRGSAKDTKMPRLVGGLFMTLGSIMLLIVLYIIYSNNQFVKRAIPVMGEVVNYDSYESSNDDGGTTTMFTPTYAYSFNGREYKYKSTTSSSAQDYSIGDKVEILVDPDDPNSILINDFWERWLLVLVLGFLGTMFSGMGYLVYRFLGT